MDALLQRREQPRAQRAALADQNRQLSERTGHAVAAHASQRTAHVANAARRWLDPFVCHLSDPVLDLEREPAPTDLPHHPSKETPHD